ncbi:uncharacterized protein EHS24_000935 [Apiotrichum porosum]|uniref:Uncharacterized protein n=1 Tax=Apiotrichum porosum TaxID=105984 RepID=A0A427YBK4_9TREE|nr:uncharacterized protein EHS24_000935 [Apiotrichum porosum]RSH88394.1 hypothetical protein EHS24_000935 [Apiotrichum porosum]
MSTTAPLDCLYFPHILDAIIEYAKFPSLLVLAATSKALKARIGPRIAGVQLRSDYIVVTRHEGPEYLDGRPVPPHKWDSIDATAVDFPGPQDFAPVQVGETCVCKLGHLRIKARVSRQSVPVCRHCIEVDADKAVVFFDLRKSWIGNPLVVEPGCIVRGPTSLVYTILINPGPPHSGTRLIPLSTFPPSVRDVLIRVLATKGSKALPLPASKNMSDTSAPLHDLLLMIVNLIHKQSYNQSNSHYPECKLVGVGEWDYRWLQPSRTTPPASFPDYIKDIIEKLGVATYPNWKMWTRDHQRFKFYPTFSSNYDSTPFQSNRDPWENVETVWDW